MAAGAGLGFIQSVSFHLVTERAPGAPLVIILYAFTCIL
jgi:hypothetical protein